MLTYLRRSDGMTTGISTFTPNKYQLISGTYIDAIAAEKYSEGTTMDNNDASIECSRYGCDAFVRKDRDGHTTYYKLTAPYSNYFQPENIGKDEVIVVDAHSTGENLKEKLDNPNNTPNKVSSVIYVIILIILIGVIICFLCMPNKNSMRYRATNRPLMTDETNDAV